MPLMTTAEVAEEIAMSQDWVRDHAGELGAIRAGRGGRAPLRFEPEALEAWKRANRIRQPDVGARRRRRSRRSPSGVELLPLPPTEPQRARR